MVVHRLGRRQLTCGRRALNYQSSSMAMLQVDGGGLHCRAKETRMPEGVRMSERAARRISEILETEPPGAMMRVSVEGGGCSGFQYKFDIERDKADDDLVIAHDHAVVLIDPLSLRYMEGAEIDFIDDLIGASFKVSNPNATASCGCGTSFSV